MVFGLLLPACGGSGKLATSTPACALLAQLAATAQTVAHADVADPDAFEAQLDTAVTEYVRTARRLRSMVPANLRVDFDRLATAAQTRRFGAATVSRTRVAEYARSECGARA